MKWYRTVELLVTKAGLGTLGPDGQALGIQAAQRLSASD